METVDDILRDIMSRAEVACRQDGDATVHHSAVAAMLHDIADRIDAAYKRDLQAMVDAGQIDMRTAMDEVTRLSEENARLKAALKPIIEFRPQIVGDYGEEEAWDSDLMMEAMVESRRIYNGGEE